MPPSSYDMYMFGIIVLSIAVGVDIPHISKGPTKRAFEMILREVRINTVMADLVCESSIISPSRKTTLRKDA